MKPSNIVLDLIFSAVAAAVGFAIYQLTQSGLWTALVLLGFTVAFVLAHFKRGNPS